VRVPYVATNGNGSPRWYISVPWGVTKTDYRSSFGAPWLTKSRRRRTRFITGKPNRVHKRTRLIGRNYRGNHGPGVW